MINSRARKENMNKEELIDNKYMEQAQVLSKGAEIMPDGVKGLAKKLQKSAQTGIPLRVKLGLDPTRPDLHLGHTVVMRKLRLFQEFGHRVVLIIGGATAMVGDPSGKSETRPALSKEQVEQNAQTYFEQMSKVVDVESAEVLNNADWLHKMQFTDLLKLAASTTVAQLMARDDFNKRYKEGLPISVVEFFYPLMQGYDSVEVNADIELGGQDQTFNLLMGRAIQEFYGLKKQQLAMVLPLIEGTDGVVKMSKTYPQHCISLTDDPKDMYGKLMSIPDELMPRYYLLLTELHFNKNTNPRDEKMRLAFELTRMYNSEEAAIMAQNEFINVVQNKRIPSEIPEIRLDTPANILDILVSLGFCASKGEAKRLIVQNAVKFDDEKISDTGTIIDRGGIVQAGKRNYAKITF